VFWLSNGEVEAIRLTLLVSMTAVMIAFPFAVAVGWVSSKRSFFGKTALNVFVNLPLVLPPVVTGYLMLVLLGRNSWIGSAMEAWFGFRFVFDWKGAALASAIVGFPMLVRPIKLAFEQIDERLLLVARSLGASKWSTFCWVALPLARSGMISGCILAFARSMGEFGATMVLAGNIPGETQTISLMIYALMDGSRDANITMRLVVASIAIASLALWLGESLDQAQRTRYQWADR
jgi:molybdate transport system permease protein